MPDLKVMEYPSLNIASGTSQSPALSLDNIHDQYAAEINHSLDDFILVESDSDVKYSDIELDERLEAPGGETWQNTGVDSHMVVDYISDGTPYIFDCGCQFNGNIHLCPRLCTPALQSL